ncbi:MAG: hypothetical protein HN758_09900 [Verrucomicrobia bacterium]|jgi:hypothetical protein|nr:hypothetical protein [Verrucomicrobiota bacterium]MBT7874727.1 hypothetical protein [Verrucomicrobiota bacterium]
MRNKKDFGLLENWADLNLKKISSTKIPEGFLDRVMDRANGPEVTDITPEKPSAVISWVRFLVVLSSLLLMAVGFFWNTEAAQNWWSSTRPGMTFDLIQQLLISLEQVSTTLIQLVPSVIWSALGVSLGIAYLVTAVIGSTLFHFTVRRLRMPAI